MCEEKEAKYSSLTCYLGAFGLQLQLFENEGVLFTVLVPPPMNVSLKVLMKLSQPLKFSVHAFLSSSILAPV